MEPKINIPAKIKKRDEFFEILILFIIYDILLIDKILVRYYLSVLTYLTATILHLDIFKIRMS